MDKTEKMFRSIFFDSPLGMMLFDKNGDIKLCNNEIKNIFKSDAQDLEGDNISKLIYKEDVEGFLRELSDLSSKKHKKLKIEVRFKKGRIKLGWCRFNISGVNYNENGP